MNSFLSVYALANRLGLMRVPIFRQAFSKAYFLYKASIEDPFTPLTRDYAGLFAGGHILDVGANIGYTATLFSRVLSPGFRVYAFEPEARNFEMLEQELHSRAIQNVTAVHAAVGDKKGMQDLWFNPKHHADHRMVTSTFSGVQGSAPDTQQVPVLRLDDFWVNDLQQKPVRFIKIDVQGYEECVCRGMSDLLAKNPDAIVGLEYYPEGIESLGFKPADVLFFFKDRGYAVYSLTRRQGLQDIPYDAIAAKTASGGYIDLVFSKSGTILDGTIQ